MNKDSSAEIDPTPEMIDAVVNRLYDFDPNQDDPYRIAREVLFECFSLVDRQVQP